MRRAVLVWLAAGGAVVGAWALAAPASFYGDFGLFQAWVAMDGPYNEHLVRDVGGLNLGMAVLSAAAIAIGDRRVDAAVSLAWLVYGVPHLGYHATHLSPFGAADAVAQLLALVTFVILPLLLLVPRRRPHRLRTEAPA